MARASVMTSRHVRAYRALLRLYPHRFRGEYRDEMTRLFADQLRDARATEGPVGVIRLWARSLVDLVVTAPGQHLEKEVLVASPAGSTEKRTVASGRPPTTGWYLVVLAPLWVAVAVSSVAPGFMDPIYANPPGILGLPAGVILVGLALTWMALGMLALAGSSSDGTRMTIIAVFTIPAVIAIMSGPTLILTILQLNT